MGAARPKWHPNDPKAPYGAKYFLHKLIILAPGVHFKLLRPGRGWGECVVSDIRGDAPLNNITPLTGLSSPERAKLKSKLSFDPVYVPL